MKHITNILLFFLLSVTHISCSQYNEISGKLTLYEVSNGELKNVIKKYNEVNEFDKNKQLELFEFVKKLIPKGYIKNLNEFMVFEGKLMGSDGFMTEISRKPSKWLLALAIDYGFENSLNNNGVLAHTIIHEFGHYIALNESLLNPNLKQKKCKTLYTDDACSNKDSYLNKFYQKFWAKISDEHQIAKSNNTVETTFFDKHKEQFNSLYSSYNTLEDFAEVFSFFVQWEKPIESTSIKNQKILFMYQFKELTTLRDSIRKNIKLDNIKFPKKGFYDKK